MTYVHVGTSRWREPSRITPPSARLGDQSRAGLPTYHVYAGNGSLMWEENAAGMTEFIYLHGKQVATRKKTN